MEEHVERALKGTRCEHLIRAVAIIFENDGLTVASFAMDAGGWKHMARGLVNELKEPTSENIQLEVTPDELRDIHKEAEWIVPRLRVLRTGSNFREQKDEPAKEYVVAAFNA